MTEGRFRISDCEFQISNFKFEMWDVRLRELGIYGFEIFNAR